MKEKKKRKSAPLLESIFLWLGSTFLFLILGIFIFMESEIPDWWYSVSLFVPIIFAVDNFIKKAKARKKPASPQQTFTRGKTSSPMADSLRSESVPFFKGERNRVALNLLVDSKIAAEKANKSRTISEFIVQYDIVLDCFKKLTPMSGKVTSVHGDLFAEYCRLSTEFQKHLHDSIERSACEILDNHKGLYKYDPDHTRNSILNFKADIDTYGSRFSEENKEFSMAQFRYLCNECKMTDLLLQSDVRMNSSTPSLLSECEIAEISRRETAWRSNMTSPDYVQDALGKVDAMSGVEFELWCANLLKDSGFINVSMTKVSGDQGVDILAENNGVKYAIQCKCYSSDLGNTPIQEVNTGKTIYHCHVGVVMTNRHFTVGAKNAANATGVLLWDRDKLSEMIKKSVS